MSDGQWLYLAFSLFYLSECFRWLPLEGIAFRRWITRRWHPLSPSKEFAARDRGLLFAHPWPPPGDLLWCDSPPVIPHALGLAVKSNGSWHWQLLPWAQLEARRDKKTIILSPYGLTVNLGSTTAARYLARWLHSISSASDISTRDSLIEQGWQRVLSLPRAKASIRRYHLVANSLRPICLLSFISTFILIPVTALIHGPSASLAFIALATWMLSWWVALLSLILHRRAFPDLPGRWPRLFSLIFLPYQVPRAHDLFAMETFALTHPLAAARVSLGISPPDKIFPDFWRSCAHEPDLPGLSTHLQQVLADHRLRLGKALTSWGLSISQLKTPSPSPDQDSSHYCPRCLAQFSSAAPGIQGTLGCPDCFGLPLIPLGHESNSNAPTA